MPSASDERGAVAEQHKPFFFSKTIKVKTCAKVVTANDELSSLMIFF
jgi:hypothetical protein